MKDTRLYQAKYKKQYKKIKYEEMIQSKIPEAAIQEFKRPPYGLTILKKGNQNCLVKIPE